jgi:hypothetical protein
MICFGGFAPHFGRWGERSGTLKADNPLWGCFSH